MRLYHTIDLKLHVHEYSFASQACVISDRIEVVIRWWTGQFSEVSTAGCDLEFEF